MLRLRGQTLLSSCWGCFTDFRDHFSFAQFAHFNCCVEPQDPAVITLVDHFKKIITEITDGKWSHPPSKWISKKDKQKLYAADRTQVQRVLDMDSQPFFLAYHRLEK